MAEHPPTPDLGARIAKLRRIVTQRGEEAISVVGTADLRAVLDLVDAQAARLAAMERLLADQDDALATQAARLAQIRTVGTRLVEALTHGAPEETFTALRLELARHLAPPDARGAAGAREAHDGV